MKEENNRIEKILTMILLNSLKGMTIAEKAHQLNIAGLTNVEIADFLETTPAVISQSLYAKRKDKKEKK